MTYDVYMQMSDATIHTITSAYDVLLREMLLGIFLIQLLPCLAILYRYDGVRLPTRDRIAMYFGKTNNVNFCFNHCKRRHANTNGAEVSLQHVRRLNLFNAFH